MQESEKVDSTKGKNRELGLGRAPGIDLAAIYSNLRGDQPSTTKKRKLKHKASEFSKNLSIAKTNFKTEQNESKS